MKPITVQNAILSLLVATGLTVAVQPAFADDIAVVRIKAVEGLDVPGAGIEVMKESGFMAGSRIHVSRSSVSSLDGVKTLVLVERRSDSKSGDMVKQSTTTEVLAVNGDTFTLKGLDGKNMAYAVDVLSDGSVDLIGPTDRITARSGGRFTIWKIESVSMMSRNSISIY